MSNKPSTIRRKSAVRPTVIALTTTAFCAVVTYGTVQHANGDDARIQWVITCLIALVFFVVVLPTFILRARDSQPSKSAERYPEYNSTAGGAPPGSNLSTRTIDDPWWEDVFAKFDAGERGPKTISIVGLLIGPLYYFCLRMWRKGLAIIGLALCAVVVLDLLHVVLGLPSSVQNVVGFAMGAFCMFMVKRDYYMLKRHGETMWPQTDWLDSRAVLTALIVVPLLIAFGRGFADDSDDTPAKASMCSTCGVEGLEPLVIAAALPSVAATRAEEASRVDD